MVVKLRVKMKTNGIVRFRQRRATIEEEKGVVRVREVNKKTCHKAYQNKIAKERRN